MAKKIKTDNSNVNFGGAPTVTSMFALSKENKKRQKENGINPMNQILL